MSKTLKIALTKSQADFLEITEDYPGFFGGLGAGKSFTLGLKAVLGAFHSPSAVVGVYAPSYDLIRLVSIPAVEFWLEQFGLKRNKDFLLNKTEHTITTFRKDMGNFLFKSLMEPDALVGYETSEAHADELDKLSAEKAAEAWDAIVSRNRLQLTDAPPEHYRWSEENQRTEYINRTHGYSSPEGYKFCYKRWKVDPSPAYVCVHADARDNPKLSAAYIRERSKHMSPAQFKCYIEGQFANMQSGTVYYNYNRETCRSSELVQEHDVLYVGCDFNVGKMACTVYVRRNGGKDWHAVDESFGLLDTPNMISWLLAKYGEHHIIMYPDSSGAARSASNGASTSSSIAQLKNAGFEVRARAKNPRVSDRVAATNLMFSKGRLFINDIMCPETARCLEQQAYNKNNEPDKDSGTDHQNDATTYPIAYECSIIKPIFKIDYSFVQKSA